MKFIVKWNIGYGPNADVVEAKDIEEAEKIAYEMWREDVEGGADYSAEEYSDEEWEQVR